jgi:hypothetical protein
MTRLHLLLSAALLASSPVAAQAPQQPGISQQDIDLLRRDVAAARKEITAQTLSLTPDEAARFWPVYDQYAAEAGKITAERAAIIKEYAENFGKIDAKRADSLTRRSLAVDVAMAKLRTDWLPRFEKAVPTTKAASFIQIDRRLSTLIDLQLAANLPLMQDQ